MARQKKQQRLGRRAALLDDTWEADFRALRNPMLQSETHFVGFVVSKKGALLAQSEVEGRPTADDLARLLDQAMRRPLTGKAHRPRRLHVRGRRQWQEVFPHLRQLNVEVSVCRELPSAKAAYENYRRQSRDARRAGMVKPTGQQAVVETSFPAVAEWVRGYGHIEVGDQEGFGFVVRALDYGGVIFEDENAETLAEAMVALETGLAKYFKKENIEAK